MAVGGLLLADGVLWFVVGVADPPEWESQQKNIPGRANQKRQEIERSPRGRGIVTKIGTGTGGTDESQERDGIVPESTERTTE